MHSSNIASIRIYSQMPQAHMNKPKNIYEQIMNLEYIQNG